MHRYRVRSVCHLRRGSRGRWLLRLNDNRIKVSKHTMTRTLLLIAPVFMASCTYAPRTTQIDQTYSARIMAIGVSDKSGGITSTTHVGDEEVAAPAVIPVRDGFDIGSTYAEVVALQGPPSLMGLPGDIYFGYSMVTFSRGRNPKVISWSDRGNLKLRGKRL